MNDIKIGLPPESIIYTGQKKSFRNNNNVICYNSEGLRSRKITKYSPELNCRNWLSIVGLNEVNMVRELVKTQNINSLVLEDIFNVGHKAKIDVGNEYIFIIIEYPINNSSILEKNNLSIYFSNDSLITFWDHEKILFEKIKVRLESKDSMVRNGSMDFLLSRLLDRIVDEYFVVSDSFNDLIDIMEDEVFLNAKLFNHMEIHSMKKEVRKLRRSVLSAKETLYSIWADPSELIKEVNIKYFKDTFDHSIQILENCDIQIEQLNSIKNTYDSEINTSLNQTMKVLTLISSIFIPTTFIAGVLGMNFEYIPGTKSEFGFFYVIGIMALITCLFLVYFKKKKWF